MATRSGPCVPERLLLENPGVRPGFPETPRATRAVQVGALALGIAVLSLATVTTLSSIEWVGRPFPGFLLLPNRVVASIGLAGWPGGPELYQREVVAVDGKPVATTTEAYDAIASCVPGTPVRWRLRTAWDEIEVVVPCVRFGWRDWCLLFGAYLLNSAVYLGSGLVTWVLRSRAAMARTLLLFGTTCAVWMVTAMDLYGPAIFYRLHILGESFFPATGFHLALLFPAPHRFARFAWVGYVAAVVLAGAYEWVAFDPPAYTLVHNIATFWLGCAAVFFGWRLVLEWWRGREGLARQRIRVMTLGTLFGFAFPGGVFLASALSGGGVPVNTGAFTGFLFAAALAYAIVKHDLFEIDAMVKRGAYYLLLTGAVGASYITAVVLFNLALPGTVADSPAFPVAFTLAVLLVFNPLRTRLQTFVDRVFFRTTYDGARVLEAVGSDLSSALTREQVAALVRGGIERAVPNAGTRLFAGRPGDRVLREIGGAAVLPAALQAPLAGGRMLTAFDPPESHANLEALEATRRGLAEIGAEVAVPLLWRGTLVGALTVGPKRSGLFYTAGDAAFLRALAHQTAIALENAEAYEALVALNASLEQRVLERTRELEASNRELASALRELEQAHVQLVQSEKMASLGRLVAGVAHEINNPVSFIASTVAPLRRRLARAAAAVGPEGEQALREASELIDLMARGAERTAAIVKDLRTFSRLGEAVRKPVDLEEGLEVSLRLLGTRLGEQVVVERAYGRVPPIEGDPGQLNQVFMNLLGNAADAVGARGTIRVATWLEGEEAVVEVRDSGRGMPPEVLGRIFEPFFTTKDVGQGTGLGLAISHGIVTAHGGRIEVESQPGAGTTFRVRLPLQAASLDSAARASG